MSGGFYIVKDNALLENLEKHFQIYFRLGGGGGGGGAEYRGTKRRTSVSVENFIQYHFKISTRSSFKHRSFPLTCFNMVAKRKTLNNVFHQPNLSEEDLQKYSQLMKTIWLNFLKMSAVRKKFEKGQYRIGAIKEINVSKHFFRESILHQRGAMQHLKKKKID